MINSFQHGLLEVARAVAPPQVPHKILDIHGRVHFLGVVVVLVDVEHDDGVREAERRVRVRERLAVCALEK